MTFDSGAVCGRFLDAAVLRWPAVFRISHLISFFCNGQSFSCTFEISFRLTNGIYYFFLVEELQRGGEGERERSSIHWVAPQMPVTARAGPELHAGLPHGRQGPQHFSRHPLPSQVH